ncbi:cholesterol 25-hydroxylase [Plakobranchus ocellatus]|uniref:Cholesterol 25-hydroxylase n=1 Tax=Plakobranchus ocellatus TaxID=259542 RepID=A0AAV3ZFV1_9GAST|nr:cholesterol 25-hydroxylase [Plakobranchus ocellatus]
MARTIVERTANCFDEVGRDKLFDSRKREKRQFQTANKRLCLENESQSDDYKKETNIARAFVLMCLCLSIHYRANVQVCIDVLWNYLRRQSFFYSAYFESVYVTVVYGLIIALYPYTMHYISYLSKFRVKDDVTYVHQTVAGIAKDAVVYLAPLFFADAVIQKKYSGVSEEEWAIRSKQWIQTTRALPSSPPAFLTLCVHVVGSVIVFDALFFVVHLTLHKNAFLYRHVHALHHRHGAMHAHVTNQLTVVERGSLIVAANYSLKLFSAHPLTRLVFVVVFLWLLVDNHTGYDLPWSPHRLAPCGLLGGPATHHAHHINGARHYQPFFTYLDILLDRWSRKEPEVKQANTDSLKPQNSSFFRSKYRFCEEFHEAKLE